MLTTIFINQPDVKFTFTSCVAFANKRRKAHIFLFSKAFSITYTFTSRFRGFRMHKKENTSSHLNARLNGAPESKLLIEF